MAKRYELTNVQWARIAALLPGKAGDPGRTAADNRLFVNSVLWVLRSGAHCHDLPMRYGKWKSVHTRFSRWANKGVWERVFKALIDDPNNEYLMLDTTLVRAHQQAATGKGGTRTRLWGVRGGLTTKIHMLADALGRPLRFILTGGQAHDIVTAAALLDGMKGGAVIADKAYDSNDLRRIIADADMLAVIPSKRSRKVPIPHDIVLYKTRNRIERCFNKLKHFRRFATRFDRRAGHFLAFTHLAAAMLWMR